MLFTFAQSSQRYPAPLPPSTRVRQSLPQSGSPARSPSFPIPSSLSLHSRPPPPPRQPGRPEVTGTADRPAPSSHSTRERGGAQGEMHQPRPRPQPQPRSAHGQQTQDGREPRGSTRAPADGAALGGAGAHSALGPGMWTPAGGETARASAALWGCCRRATVAASLSTRGDSLQPTAISRGEGEGRRGVPLASSPNLTRSRPSPLQTPQTQPRAPGAGAGRAERAAGARARHASPLPGSARQCPGPASRDQDSAFPGGPSERGAGPRTRNAHPL